VSPGPELGTPVDWRPVPAPSPGELGGRTVLLRSVRPAQDAAPLFAASHPPAGDPGLWTYLPYGPYEDPAALQASLEAVAVSSDPLFFVVAALPAARPAGIASYLRITPQHGTIEIGHIWFGAGLARTTAASEAIHLLAAHVFDTLGYRRLEWKCNALNAASRRAAERFGFRFEGVFRHHQVVKGRNRDTAWYAITDAEWPAVAAAFRAWLDPANFDPMGRQRRTLASLMAERGGATGPAGTR
jgi:RimJ/RimL family protein N-acetyltransferase